jgi:hypothetical protein
MDNTYICKESKGQAKAGLGGAAPDSEYTRLEPVRWSLPGIPIPMHDDGRRRRDEKTPP